MTKAYNCSHPKRQEGMACAGCLDEAQYMLQRAYHIIKEMFPNSCWLIDVKPALLRKKVEKK